MRPALFILFTLRLRLKHYYSASQAMPPIFLNRLLNKTTRLSAVSSLRGVLLIPLFTLSTCEPVDDDSRWTTERIDGPDRRGPRGGCGRARVCRAALWCVVGTIPDVGHKMRGFPRWSAQRDCCLRLQSKHHVCCKLLYVWASEAAPFWFMQVCMY